jgi:hypothetical protein
MTDLAPPDRALTIGEAPAHPGADPELLEIVETSCHSARALHKASSVSPSEPAAIGTARRALDDSCKRFIEIAGPLVSPPQAKG